MYKPSVSLSFRSPRSAWRTLLSGSALLLALTSATWSSTAWAQAAAGATTKAAPKVEAKAATPEAKPATPEAKTTKAPAEAAPSDKPAEAAGATAAAPAPTPAQVEEARVSLEAGTKAHAAGDFAGALTSFNKANAAVPSAEAEFWIAKTTDDADAEDKDPKASVDAYAKFLANPKASDAGAERVTDAQTRVEALKKLLPATLTLTTVPAGASVIVDGKPHDQVTPVTLELPAGAHKVELALEGHENSVVELDVQGGSTVEQAVELAPVAPPPAAPAAAPAAATEPAPEKKSIVPAAVTLGLGAAGLISGTLFGIMALDAKNEFNDNPTTENADAAERNALIADMSFGIALTLGITGIVLLTADDTGEAAATARTSRVQVAPYAGKRGGGLTGRVTF